MIQAKIDGTYAAVAVSSPLWLQYLDQAAQVTLILIGVTIGLVRLAIVIREWRRKR